MIRYNTMETDAIGNIPHGRAVSYKPQAMQAIRYISFDDTSHNGGFWKAAGSSATLARKNTRSRTCDSKLRWVGEQRRAEYV